VGNAPREDFDRITERRGNAQLIRGAVLALAVLAAIIIGLPAMSRMGQEDSLLDHHPTTRGVIESPDEHR